MTVPVASDWQPPKGWDIADAVADGWTAEQVVAWARPRVVTVEPPRPAETPPDEPPPVTSEADYGMEPEPAAPAPKKKRSRRDAADDMPLDPLPPERVGEGQFRCLGYDEGHYFFYPFVAGQVVSMTPSTMTSANLLQLADHDYWISHYGSAKSDKINEAWVRQALMSRCHAAGIYSADVRRGRGAWMDGKRTVVHLGDALIVDGERVELCDMQSRYIYERRPSAAIEVGRKATNAETVKLAQMCKLIRWEQPERDGGLLAGWIFAAIVCGAMKWRTHIYCIGAKGSGKSWVVENIVEPMLRGMSLNTQGKSTEASIRQMVKIDAIPVIMDESEGEGPGDRERMQGVFGLARSASSENGAPIHKGSADGRGASYIMRSAFFFGSINKSMGADADESRTITLRLRHDRSGDAGEREADADRFAELERIYAATWTQEWRDAIVARALGMIDVMRDNHATFAKAAAQRFGSTRVGKTLGMPLAGLYGLHSSGRVTVDQALEFIARQEWPDQDEQAASSGDGDLVDFLMELHVRVEVNAGAVTRTVGSLIKRAAQIDMDDMQVSADMASQALLMRGFDVDGYRFWVSNTHSWIREKLAKTAWAVKWHETLLRVPDAEKSGKSLRFKGMTKGAVAKAVGLPLSILS